MVTSHPLLVVLLERPQKECSVSWTDARHRHHQSAKLSSFHCTWLRRMVQVATPEPNSSETAAPSSSSSTTLLHVHCMPHRVQSTLAHRVCCMRCGLWRPSLMFLRPSHLPNTCLQGLLAPGCLCNIQTARLETSPPLV